MEVRLEDPRRGRSGSGTIGTLENKANSALMYSHASHIFNSNADLSGLWKWYGTGQYELNNNFQDCVAH